MTHKKQKPKIVQGGFIPAPQLDMTDDERTSLREYTNGKSLEWNSTLRDMDLTAKTHGEKNMAEYRRNIMLINDAIWRSPASTAPVMVYRAVEPVEPWWADVRVNAILPHTMKGMISTSFSREAAEGFLEKEAACCLLVLSLPKNTRGIFIGDGSSGFDDEDELLLPHGSSFRVTKVTHPLIPYVTYASGFAETGKRRVVCYYAKLVNQQQLLRLDEAVSSLA